MKFFFISNPFTIV